MSKSPPTRRRVKANPEKIPQLKPAFAKEGRITAATSRSIRDGAAARADARKPRRRARQKPVARRRHGGACAGAEKFATAPFGAIPKVLEKAGWTANDVDLWKSTRRRPA